MKRHLLGLGADNRAAVAPTVALSLFALIGAGGIAFDYARMAGLDTELQNAADQAALAGATQLDGESGAISRATAAAQGLLVNATLTANDGTGTGITVPTVVFYETKDDAENDTNPIDTSSTTADEDARFVRVVVDAREVNFALTPVVGALSSGQLDAEAVAGLGSSICKVPPLMMCNPQEGDGNDGDPLNFDIDGLIGVGLRLVEGGGGSWAPGNFGYLQTGLGPGANVLEYALGANSPPGDCLATDGVTTKPGENTSVTDAINTRFDIYENGLTNDCTSGTCSPSVNVRKDVVRPAGSTNYGFKTGNDPWDLPTIQYLPNTSTGVQASPYPTSMGHPRDICHARDADQNDAECAGGRLGDGIWDRNLYFYVNHGPSGSGLFTPAVTGTPDANWQTISSLIDFATDNSITLSEITRYQTYLWEIEEAASSPGALDAYFSHQAGNGKNQKNYYNYGEPQSGAGLAAGPTQLDRRLSAVAVVNCTAQSVQGQSKDVTVESWVEVFFVEPSIARPRTVAGDIYVEIVRETTAGGNAPTNPQVVRRDVPYLVK
jgi:Flp pilus assembly protein TadG